MTRVDEVVYCTVHGQIHDATNDPFDYGDEVPECDRPDWRTVYYRPHKRDEP